MTFLDKLYSSNYFGIGLFAVISFLVVSFLVVLFFGKRDQKRRSLEVAHEAEDTFKETTPTTNVEVPKVDESVKPIDLDTINDKNVIEPVIPVAPLPINDNEFMDNLVVEEPIKQVNDSTDETPFVTPVKPIINEVKSTTVELEPIKIVIPNEPVKPIINEEVRPVIKEEEPQLQINEEPVINTYYKPTESSVETESIKVPNIDFDSLAKSISAELDELESKTSKYDEIKITPLHNITVQEEEKKPVAVSSIYVREPVSNVTKGEMELPRKIDLPARKSE